MPDRQLPRQPKRFCHKKTLLCSLCVIVSFFILLTIAYFTPVKTLNLSTETCSLTICVSDDGMHTNIWLPVKNQIFDWSQYISLQDLGNPVVNYKYLSFGWGDRDFYIKTPTFADLKLSTAFRALFLPTPATILVQGRQNFTNLKLKCVPVSKNAYLQLTKFIKNTFTLDRRRNTIKITNGHSKHSVFYEAKGSYSILKTCNNWTAEALKTAKVDTPIWAGLSSAIMLHLNSSCNLHH